MKPSTAIQYHSNAIDDATLAYGGREDIDDRSDLIELDDMGFPFQPCAVTQLACDYKTECGVTTCRHCRTVVAV